MKVSVWITDPEWVSDPDGAVRASSWKRRQGLRRASEPESIGAEGEGVFDVGHGGNSSTLEIRMWAWGQQRPTIG